MSNERNAEDFALKHFLTIDGNRASDWYRMKENQPENFNAIINSMEEYATLRIAQLEAEKAEILEMLEKYATTFGYTGSCVDRTLARELYESSITLIQKHAKK